LEHGHLPAASGRTGWWAGIETKDEGKGTGRSTNPNDVRDVFQPWIDAFQTIGDATKTTIHTTSFRPTVATHVVNATVFATNSQVIHHARHSLLILFIDLLEPAMDGFGILGFQIRPCLKFQVFSSVIHPNESYWFSYLFPLI
jgi:hypothetical protein